MYALAALALILFHAEGIGAQIMTNSRGCECKEWAPWSACSHTCGPGTQARERDCVSSTKSQACTHEVVESRHCAADACEPAERAAVVETLEGAYVRLECVAPNEKDTTVHWLTPSGKHISPHSKTHKYEMEGSYLYVVHVGQSDEGVYHCLVLGRNGMPHSGDAGLVVQTCQRGNPCHNGGQCLEMETEEGYSQFTCSCTSGFDGEFCDSRRLAGWHIALMAIGILLFVTLLAISTAFLCIRKRRIFAPKLHAPHPPDHGPCLCITDDIALSSPDNKDYALPGPHGVDDDDPGDLADYAGYQQESSPIYDTVDEHRTYENIPEHDVTYLPQYLVRQQSYGSLPSEHYSLQRSYQASTPPHPPNGAKNAPETELTLVERLAKRMRRPLPRVAQDGYLQGMQDGTEQATDVEYLTLRPPSPLNCSSSTVEKSGNGQEIYVSKKVIHLSPVRQSESGHKEGTREGSCNVYKNPVYCLPESLAVREESTVRKSLFYDDSVRPKTSRGPQYIGKNTPTSGLKNPTQSSCTTGNESDSSAVSQCRSDFKEPSSVERISQGPSTVERDDAQDIFQKNQPMKRERISSIKEVINPLNTVLSPPAMSPVKKAFGINDFIEGVLPKFTQKTADSPRRITHINPTDLDENINNNRRPQPMFAFGRRITFEHSHKRDTNAEYSSPQTPSSTVFSDNSSSPTEGSADSSDSTFSDPSSEEETNPSQEKSVLLNKPFNELFSDTEMSQLLKYAKRANTTRTDSPHKT